MAISSWFRFFRLPNLPTAPGDALAGAAVGLSFAGGDVRRALAAGGAALFFYMFGLADNDVVGAKSDERNAPDRPLPRGEISLRAAKTARGLCLVLALALGAGFNLLPAWWICAAALTGTICLYNRTKNLWLMGLCRGVSVLCGAAAVVRPSVLFSNESAKVAGESTVAMLLVFAAMVLGWTFYIAAVTKLSEGEETASGGLGAWRYWLGATTLVPALASMGLPSPQNMLLPIMGCLWAFARWSAAVAPLGEAHDAATRRRAVGNAIGALLYLQLGFLLVEPWNRAFVVAALILWFAARLIRRLVPSISGS